MKHKFGSIALAVIAAMTASNAAMAENTITATWANAVLGDNNHQNSPVVTGVVIAGDSNTVDGYNNNTVVGYSNNVKDGHSNIAVGDYNDTQGSSMAFGTGLTLDKGTIAFSSNSSKALADSASNEGTVKPADHTSFSDGGFHVGGRVMRDLKDGIVNTDAVTLGQMNAAIAKVSASGGSAGGLTEEQVKTIASNAKQSAVAYTDTETAKAVTTANKHADEVGVASNKYTDKVASTTLASANEHANEVGKTTLTSAKKYTDYVLKSAGGVTEETVKSMTDRATSDAKAYTDKQVTFLNNRIDKVQDSANAGTAAAMAMATMPVKFGYKYEISTGAATYNGQSALAIGVIMNPSDNVSLSVKASGDTQSNFGLAAGVSYGFN